MDKKNENQEKEPYRFMKEVIKKKPLDKRALLLKIAAVAAAAVAAGAIAAFVFVRTVPVAEELLGTASQAQVDIPADEEPDRTETASTSSSGAQENQTPVPEVTGTPVPTPVPSQEPEAAQSITVDAYRELYQEMLAVAETPKRAMVTVIGITSHMDYFNQNYENQQQISGLIVADNGKDLFVLTEYRVVENVERIQVTFFDGTMVDAIYQRHDGNTGLTILRVSLEDVDETTRENIEVAPLGNSYTVSQGEPVLALGSPIGYSDSVAYGIITSVNNKISTLDTEYNLLTTDILGSSDGSGILVNLDGEIIGVIAQSYSSSEDKNIVTGLAISQIKELIERLSNNVSQAYIGIKGQNVTAEIAEKTGIPKGVLVTAVQPDSPAMLSGLKEYDVIVRVGDTEVATIREYNSSLKKLTPGQTVTVTAMRMGAEGYVEVAFDVTTGEI